MKFIEEGLKNGTIMLDTPFELVYGGGLREFGLAYLRDFSKYSQEARREIIELIVLNCEEDICRSYLEDIYCAMYTWNGSLLRFGVERFDSQSRKLLIKEMLLWKEWGVSTIDEILYKVAFRLLYYGMGEFLGFSFELFENYPKSWRKKVIKGMLASDQLYELEMFSGIALAELNRPRRYSRTQRKNMKMMLFKEFGRWQKWGAGLSFMRKDLEYVLKPFICNSDAVGFGAFLKVTGIKLDENLAETLVCMVNQSKFKKQHTQQMFLDSIYKNRL